MNNPARYFPDQMTVPLAKKILPKNLQHLPLNPREYKFIGAYCSNGFNSAEAARQAGYACRTKAHYKNIGHEILNRSHVMEALKIYFEQIMKPYKERLEYEVMDRYYKRATYTVDTFMQSNGRVKPLKDIPEEWLECIDGVEEKWFGKDSSQMTIIYRLPNRDAALQMLYKMVTGYDPNDNGSGMLPADARTRLSSIFTAAMTAAGKPQPKNVTPQKPLIEEE